MPKPYVAIVGRPNVGKSTFFNRLIGERRAVVSDIPGTTRDRIITETEWNDRSFVLVDTGGIEVLPSTVDAGRRPGPENPLLEDSAAFIPLIRAQAEQAIAEADIVLFLTDASTGLTGADQEVADLLRRTTKPVLLVANKADSERREQQAYEFYELGFDEVYTISALHGRGVADLLDTIVDLLPPETPEPKVAGTQYELPFWDVPTWASPRCSTASWARNVPLSARLLAPPATPSTRKCCGKGNASP